MAREPVERAIGGDRGTARDVRAPLQMNGDGNRRLLTPLTRFADRRVYLVGEIDP